MLRAPIALAKKLTHGALFPSHPRHPLTVSSSPSSTAAAASGDPSLSLSESLSGSAALFSEVSRLSSPSLAGEVSPGVGKSPAVVVGGGSSGLFSTPEVGGEEAGQGVQVQEMEGGAGAGGGAAGAMGVLGELLNTSSSSGMPRPRRPLSLSQATLSRQLEAYVATPEEAPVEGAWVYDGMGRLVVEDGIGRLGRPSTSSTRQQQAFWLDGRHEAVCVAARADNQITVETVPDAPARGGLWSDLQGAELGDDRGLARGAAAEVQEDVASMTGVVTLVSMLNALLSPRDEVEQDCDVESELLV